MSKSSSAALHLTASPVYLAASAINNLITGLPAGTAYFIGVVVVTMFTGQLVQHQGSLARAAWPDVVHLRWGWHRAHRAMERGQLCVDTLFDRALAWSLERLPVEAVRLGSECRSVHAIDSSTIARLRANPQKCALLGKGYCHRARRCVPANIVAVLTTVVIVNGVRVGLVRRSRFGATGEEAVAKYLPTCHQAQTRACLVSMPGLPPKTNSSARLSAMHWSGGCAKTSRCGAHPGPDGWDNAVARHCTGRCCIQERTEWKAALMKTSACRSKDVRCESGGGRMCTLSLRIRASLMWSELMTRLTSVRC